MDLYPPGLKFDYIFFNNPTLEGTPVHKTTSSDSFAGENFEINTRALKNLPNALKEGGIGYFLVIEHKNKLPKIWTQEHLRENLPNRFTCNQACQPVEIDNSIGLASSIYGVYRDQSLK